MIWIIAFICGYFVKTEPISNQVFNNHLEKGRNQKNKNVNSDTTLIEDIVHVEDFPRLENEKDDTKRIQRAIDSVINNTKVTSSTSAPINIPERNGCKIKFSNRQYIVSNIYVKDFIELVGSGVGSTQLLISGSIFYETNYETNFNTVWCTAIRDMRLTGNKGTEVLVQPSGNKMKLPNRQEHALTEGRFTNVIFEHAEIGFDLRGWNNKFDNCFFRDLGIGLNMDTVKTGNGDLVANPGDNTAIGCTFNSCYISIKMRHAKGCFFLNCASYQADYIHYFLGEGCNGNFFLGGRAEDAPKYLILIDGATLVNVDGKVFKSKKNHISENSNKPLYSRGWKEFWEETTDWYTEREWKKNSKYTISSASKNIFKGFNFYKGADFRKGRNNADIKISKDFKFIKLDGDEYTTIQDCWSGAFIDNKIFITERSISANIENNINLTTEYTGKTSHSEVRQNYGSDIKEHLNSLSIQKDKSLIMKGEHIDYYWKYTENKPKRFSLRNNLSESINIIEENGVVFLPQNALVVQLEENSDNTTIKINNDSQSNVVLITPRNSISAEFYSKHISEIYVIPENNDKVRIYHPNNVPKNCVFNLVIV